MLSLYASAEKVSVSLISLKAVNPQDNKKDNKRGSEKQENPARKNEPEIKEVPKARKQERPVVVKPKVKPVKINRPKVRKP